MTIQAIVQLTQKDAIWRRHLLSTDNGSVDAERHHGLNDLVADTASASCAEEDFALEQVWLEG